MLTLSIKADTPEELARFLALIPNGPAPLPQPVMQVTQPEHPRLIDAPSSPGVPESPSSMPFDELDSSGTPWDPRIHSCGKTRSKDGTWRPKRGVDPALVDAVFAEWRAKRATTTDPLVADDSDHEQTQPQDDQEG
ncbi:hypothetical protein SIID45300_01665 [Candidatus Magnetaquicoccaceae bacterium FCR-1]|uniref:Uncharacterized protein n=1 Tax=Candidatus Magnetaquiglobus chichijimensis TaxID=3141448 RepID=A0ABQ0C8X6_9PROT